MLQNARPLWLLTITDAYTWVLLGLIAKSFRTPLHVHKVVYIEVLRHYSVHFNHILLYNAKIRECYYRADVIFGYAVMYRCRGLHAIVRTSALLPWGTDEGIGKQTRSCRQLFPWVIFCHEVCSSCKCSSEDGETALTLSVVTPGDPNGSHASLSIATRVLLHIYST